MKQGLSLTFAEGRIDFHVQELLIARIRSDQFMRWTLIKSYNLTIMLFCQIIIVGIFKYLPKSVP